MNRAVPDAWLYLVLMLKIKIMIIFACFFLYRTIITNYTFLKEIDDHLNAAIIVLEGEEYHGNRYRDRTKPIWFTCKTSQSAVKAYYGIYK